MGEEGVKITENGCTLFLWMVPKELILSHQHFFLYVTRKNNFRLSQKELVFVTKRNDFFLVTYIKKGLI